MDRDTIKLLKELEKWKGIYDFGIQLYNGDWNIYISKDDVDLYSIGGDRVLKDALTTILEWINRVNK